MPTSHLGSCRVRGPGRSIELLTAQDLGKGDHSALRHPAGSPSDTLTAPNTCCPCSTERAEGREITQMGRDETQREKQAD
jgi:hypothetical protein